jgi:immunity protein 50 of polymorphic toxin system
MDEIQHASRLTELFGHWPSFHDAEIIGAQLRAATATPSSLELEVEIAEMSGEVDEAGFYRDRQRCRAVLRFENVSELGLLDFGPQNVLNDLTVRLTEPRDHERLKGFWGDRRYYVRFEPIAGFCEIELYCDRLEVVSAVVVERSESPEARRGAAQAISGPPSQPAT